MVGHERKRLAIHRMVVFPVLLTQLMVLLGAAAVLWSCFGRVAGYSGMLGGLVALLPNIYFAYKAFRFSGARAAQAIVRSFYAGEAGKLIFTSALFALVFIGVKPLQPLCLFGVFILTQGVGWFAPLLIKKRISN